MRQYRQQEISIEPPKHRPHRYHYLTVLKLDGLDTAESQQTLDGRRDGNVLGGR